MLPSAQLSAGCFRVPRVFYNMCNWRVTCKRYSLLYFPVKITKFIWSSIQLSTFGMWWNERFTSWICSRLICSNCVMLSYQYGPKSLRNVSNTLLNLCHEELRQFWRKAKGVQPGTSKVYLIKRPVCVCVCVYVLYIYIIYVCVLAFL